MSAARRSSGSLLRTLVTVACCAPVAVSAGDAAPIDAGELFTVHCAACHGEGRLGGMGPALLPENLQRVKRPEAAKVIAEGRPATQMPGFAGKLGEKEIAALVEHVYSPLPSVPTWGMTEVRASRVFPVDRSTLSSKPKHGADLANMFLVVELGDHHVTVLDGDQMAPLARVQSRFALHGGPKFAPSGRYAYLVSRDGWVSKLDLYNLVVTAEIRAGINTRNLAVSGDGRYVLVGNYLPHTLVILDAEDLEPLEIIDVKGDDGKTSRVSAVYAAPPRSSFIVALKDLPELWEISYGPRRAGKRFPVRRVKLDDYLDDFFFDPGFVNIIGASRDGGRGQVVNLEAGRKVATLDVPGMPHLGSGITWQWQGKTVLATPNLKEGVISVVELGTWRTIKKIPTPGPGFFLRTHENSRYAWADTFLSKQNDTLLLIDKETLEVVETLEPEPGKTAAHVEFTRDGRYALASIWHLDGAVVVYDAETLAEVKRLPMRKPSGKYNVANKVHFSTGTSR